MLKKMRKKESGFTLVELMIVVAIIGILAAIAIPQFAAYRTRSYNANAKAIAHLATGTESDLNAELGTFGGTEGAVNTLQIATAAAYAENDSSVTAGLAVAATGTTQGGRMAGSSSIGKDFAVPFGIGANMIASVYPDAAATNPGLSYHAYARHFNGDTAYAIDSDAATRIYSVSHPTWPGQATLKASTTTANPNLDEFQAGTTNGGGSPTTEWLPAS